MPIDSVPSTTNTITDSITGAISEVIIDTLGYDTIKVHIGTNKSLYDPLDDLIYFDATLDDVIWYPLYGINISSISRLTTAESSVADIYSFNISSILKIKISAASPPPVGTTDFTAILDTNESLLDGIISLPLPIGAATEATLSLVAGDLAAINAKLVSGNDIGDVTINNTSGSNAVNIQDGGNSITVDGTITVLQGTSPWVVSGTVAATQSGTWILGANSGVDIGDVTVNNAAGAFAVNIQDGGNSITVDGAVNATQSGIWTVTVGNAAGGSAVNIQDGGNSITVDGTVAATQSGAWTTGRTWVLSSGTDSILAFQGGLWDVSVNNFPTYDTNYGTVGVDTLRTASQIGNTTGQADFNAGATGAQTLRVTANQGGTWVLGANSGVDIGDVTINNAAGAAAVNIQDGGNSITVDGTFFQATQPVSLAAGATSIGKAEDTASANADVGVPAMAIRKATPANLSDTDGDYEMLQMSAGRLWTSATIDAALPTGTNNIGDVDVLTLPGVLGTKTNNNAAPGATNLGVLPALANAAAPSWTEGNLVALSTDLTGNARVKDIADGPVTPGTVAANSTLVGAQFNTTLPTLTTAQQAALQLNSRGGLIVAESPVLFQGRASTFNTPGRAGTTGQKILSLHNATGSAITVVIKKVIVDTVCTVVKVITVPPPMIRLWKVTVLPTNGTALTKNKIGGTTTSNASITILGDASADGTGSGTTLTATLPAGTIITQEYAARMITGAGYEMHDRVEFLGDTYVTLAALEGVVVFLDYTVATQNPTTDRWIASIEWTEM